MAADLSSRLFQQLAQYAFANVGASRRTTNFDNAMAILQRANEQGGMPNFNQGWQLSAAAAQSPAKTAGGGGSLFGDIVDVISRPLYFSAGFAKGSYDYATTHQEHNPIKAIQKNLIPATEAGAKRALTGLTGETKDTWSNNFEATGYMPDNPVAKFSLGLAADILGDPTTFIPVGGVAKAGVRGGARVLGKAHPLWADTKAVKQARKLAKGQEAGELFKSSTPIVPVDKAPGAFQAITRNTTAPSAIPEEIPNEVLQGLHESAQKRADDLFKRVANNADNPDELSKVIPPAASAVVKGGEQGKAVPLEVDEMLKAGGLEAERQGAGKAKYSIPEAIFKGIEESSSKGAGSPATKAAKEVAEHDAPYVESALEEGIKNAAKSEVSLDPVTAAREAGEHADDAKVIFKAANVSSAGKKTYEGIMKSLTFSLRDAPSKAIDRNKKKLTFAITSQTQKNFRNTKGRFLSNGTELPMVAKSRSTKLTPWNTAPIPNVNTKGVPGRIITRNELKDAVGKTYPKEVNKSERSFLPSNAPNPVSPEVRPPTPNANDGINQSSKAIPSVGSKAFKNNPKNIFGPVNDAVTKAIRESAGIAITKVKPGEILGDENVLQGIGARFATFMGQKDLRPLVLDRLTSAKARVAVRVAHFEKIFKDFTDDELLEAWDIVRGIKPAETATKPELVNLSYNMIQPMDEFFWSWNTALKHAEGNAVAFRTGMQMKDINRVLHRYKVPFQFTNKMVEHPVTRVPVNYKDGPNWLRSWEGAAPKSAKEFRQIFYGLQHASEQVTAEYAFIDDAAARFGSRGKTALHNVKIDHPRLVDYHFNKEMANQFSRALKTMHDVYRPNSPITKFLASSVSMWKTGVTIYNPRHHIANIIGDSYLMWLAGANDPRVFRKAAKVMQANKGWFDSTTEMKNLVGMDAVSNAITNPSRLRGGVVGKPGSIVARNKTGHEFNAQQLYVAAFNYGLLQKAGTVEDIASNSLRLPGRLGKPFGGKVHGAFAGAAEKREHFVKLAHFVDAVQKSRGANYRQIFEDAAHEVRKWHPDGMDLTKEEQMIRTLAIPFYSWTRKSIPLLVEGAVMNPQKAFTAYAKTNYNLQKSLGIEGTSLSDPYPTDQMFPSWLKDDNTPVIGKTGSAGLAGFLGKLGRQGQDEKGNPLDAYTLGMPTNPMQDLFSQFHGFGSGGDVKNAVMSSATPWARIPLELDRGKEYNSGIPIKDKGDYATNQVPMLSQFSRMTNLTPFGGKTDRASKYGVGNQEATINWGLGVNITGTGPYIKSAEFEQLPKVREQNKKYREFSNQIGYPINKKGKIPQWVKDLYNQQNGGR